jgi:hypothetical protein
MAGWWHSRGFLCVLDFYFCLIIRSSVLNENCTMDFFMALLVISKNCSLIYVWVLIFLMCEMVSNFPIKLQMDLLLIWLQTEIFFFNIDVHWMVQSKKSIQYRCCNNPNLYVATSYRKRPSMVSTNTYKCCYSPSIFVATLQRLLVGVTNAYLSVAIDPCNATSSNA